MSRRAPVTTTSGVSDPAMNASSAISSVEAVNPAALTLPVLVMRMPLGLTRNTRPLAVMRPAISLVAVPVTRFSRAAVASGWRMSTLASAPTEKLRQLTMARFERWSMVSRVGDGVWIVTSPARTSPPSGSAWASAAAGTSAVVASSASGSLADITGEPSLRSERRW